MAELIPYVPDLLSGEVKNNYLGLPLKHPNLRGGARNSG
jgi:hypothetical protein